MPGATAMVLYPRKEGSTFNKEYYLSTHMPLASKTWKKYGLKGYTVSELSGDGPYSIAVVMEWEDADGFGKAVQDPGTKEVMDDVKNFSSESAIIIHGGVIGSG